MISDPHNAIAAEHTHEVFRHEFDDVEELTKRFDSSERDAWQMPERVAEVLELQPTATVLELGAGTGYFTVRLAKHLQKGKVIAVDKQVRLVDHILDRARGLGLTNVDAQLIDTHGVIDVSEKVDLILSVDMYHHIPDRVAYFSKFIDQLKTDGRVVIIDRTTDSPGSQKFNRISSELVDEEMRGAGLKRVASFDFLPYQYFLVFQRDVESGEAP